MMRGLVESILNSAGILSDEDYDVVNEAYFSVASFRYPPPPPNLAGANNAPFCPLVDEAEKV